MVVGDIEIGTDVLIIGAGPAGYTAALECAGFGLDATLINGNELGGLCLHRGCIPVKTVMHIFDIAGERELYSNYGLNANSLAVDYKKAKEWKDKVIDKLESDIRSLCLKKGVQLIDGYCRFNSSSGVTIVKADRSQHINFKRAVIATGTKYGGIPGLQFDGSHVITEYELLRLERIPDEALILGGGYGGIIMGTLAVKMGIKATIVHTGDSIFKALDDDILAPALKWLSDRGAKIYNGKWSAEKAGDKVRVKVIKDEKENIIESKLAIVATGIVANTDKLGLENTGVKTGKNGFIPVNEDLQTSDPSIYAIGDVNDMGIKNASKAFRDGISVARVLSGRTALPEYQCMPLTISCEPPIYSAGLAEKEAASAGYNIITGRYPFSYNGKAVSMGKASGLVKVIADKEAQRILGIHITGPGAFDISSEAALAIEMGARLEDIILTIHPHPTLSEAIQEACKSALENLKKVHRE